MSKPLSYEIFGGKDSVALNALRSAIRTAAENAGHEGEYAEYDWMAEVPRTSMTTSIVDALREHGYRIVKAPSVGAATDSANATGVSSK